MSITRPWDGLPLAARSHIQRWNVPRTHCRLQTDGLEGLFVVNVTSGVVKADGAATMTKSAATGQEAGLHNVP